MVYHGTTHEFIFDCSPPALGNHVKITFTGDNITLVLCHVAIETIGKLSKIPLFIYLCIFGEGKNEGNLTYFTFFGISLRTCL